MAGRENASGGKRVQEVDSKVVEILVGLRGEGVGGGGGEGGRTRGGKNEEAGGHEVFLSQMRSDLVCVSLARTAGTCRALSVDLTISDARGSMLV